MELVSDKLGFIETCPTDDFKMNVCLPYFKDIFDDLRKRSSEKQKGIDKITFLNYCQLPCTIAERLFSLIDVDENEYLNSKEFLMGMLSIFCLPFDRKLKFVFDLYDGDKDSFITRNDVLILMSCMPISPSTDRQAKPN